MGDSTTLASRNSCSARSGQLRYREEGWSGSLRTHLSVGVERTGSAAAAAAAESKSCDDKVGRKVSVVDVDVEVAHRDSAAAAAAADDVLPSYQTRSTLP